MVLDNDSLKEEEKQKVLLNKWRLLNVIKDKIDEITNSYAKKRWDYFVKNDKISINNRIFSTLPDSIEDVKVTIDDFERFIYDKCPILNGEERTFALKVDGCSKVEWWARNVEKKPNAFYLHGYLGGKFYPDFVVKTKDGRLFLVEYKGKQLDNKETAYKKDIGEIWEKLSNDKMFFRLVFKDKMQNFIDEISK
jgi:type III restriction enzyme